MPSENGRDALRYHEQTKHSYASIRAGHHYLDWGNQPIPFKIYREVATVPLPDVGAPEGMSTFGALDPRPVPPRSRPLARSELSRILFHSAGITKRIRYPGGKEMLFRAAACTGALYHVELYVADEAGLFHYDPRHQALDELRVEDWRGALVEASGGDEHLTTAEAIVILTTTYWRNAWKYRERAYRHAFWDAGTILANLFAMSRGLGLPAHLVVSFADSQVENILDIDPENEGVVALVSLGSAAPSAATSPEAPRSIGFETVPLSHRSVDYPPIREMHRKSSFANGVEAREWRERPSVARPRALERPSADLMPEEPLESVIRRRGSARRFAREPIEARALLGILNAAALDVQTCDFYIIANHVEGIERGTFVHEDSGLKSLKKGEFRKEARFLDLEQELAGDAAANVYVLVDLEKVLDRYGDRGYRLAQLEGGILGGRIYLAVYALGLGATGLTFYDDAVTDFFSPHAAGKAVMFLVAIGVPGGRRVLFQR